MNRSDSIDQLAVALAKAQGEISSAVKESENPYFGSRYADLAAVWTAARDGLTKNGLSVSQFAETQIHDSATVVSLTTMLIHSSGQWLAGELRILPAKQDAQSIGSCLTYMRRYALAAIAGVVTEDDDGNAASGTKPVPPTKPKAVEKTESEPSKAEAAIQKLQSLVLKICQINRNATPDSVIGDYFKTKDAKPLTWDEVSKFHTDKQLKWLATGLEVIRKEYNEMLMRHPEDASQDPDVPF